MKQMYGLKYLEYLEYFSEFDLLTLVSRRLGADMIEISKIMVGKFDEEEGPRNFVRGVMQQAFTK